MASVWALASAFPSASALASGLGLASASASGLALVSASVLGSVLDSDRHKLGRSLLPVSKRRRQENWRFSGRRRLLTLPYPQSLPNTTPSHPSGLCFHKNGWPHRARQST